MIFSVEITRGNVTRRLNITAATNASARATAEQLCESGETVPARESACMLLSRAAVDPSPRMGPDHARNAATGARSEV